MADKRGQKPPKEDGPPESGEEEDGVDGIGERVNLFMGEFRIIVPGLAALLGFQLNTLFQQPFREEPEVEQWLHFIGTTMTILALAFLLMPAAYHRFTHEMEKSRGFLDFSRRCTHIAFVFIAGTLVTSMYMACYSVTQRRDVAAAVATGMLGVVALLWWFIPIHRALHVRRQR